MNVGDQLPDTVKQILLPALLGAAGTGAVSGYVSSKSNVRGESPSDRRKRIIRNALIGSALGGTAGAAIPAGLGTIGKEFSGKGFHPINSAIEGTLSNWAPIGVGGYGAWKLHQTRQGDQQRALAHILGLLKGNKGRAGMPGLIQQLSGDRESVRQVLRAISSRGQDPQAISERLKNLQLLQEAGVKNISLDELMTPGTSMSGTRNPLSNTLKGGLKHHLEGLSNWPEAIRPASLSNLMSKLVGKTLRDVPVLGDILPNSVSRADLTRIPEAYLGWVRPAVKNIRGIRTSFPAGNLARLAALGGSVWGAKRLQNLLMSENG